MTQPSVSSSGAADEKLILGGSFLPVTAVAQADSNKIELVAPSATDLHIKLKFIYRPFAYPDGMDSERSTRLLIEHVYQTVDHFNSSFIHIEGSV